MKFLDARRLTGPSLLFDGPAAILDIACSAAEAERLAPVWQAHIERMHGLLGWPACEFGRKNLQGGVSLAFTAAIDALYAASEINEWAWAECDAEFNGADSPDLDATLAALRESIADEKSDALLALQAAAAANNVTFLWDDDEVSLGLGRSSETWAVSELPDVASIDWQRFQDVPIGVITGTNGKTTTARLATHILRGGDKNVGLTSTDWIAVNDRILDRGDWSGPGGARKVLRQNDVDVAVLESARGGLLRRGLGVDKADAALITNIAEDHLGDFGSQTVDELMDIKWIVSRPVRESGRLLLNADDDRLVGKAASYPGELVWFSLDANNKVISAHVASGGLAFVLDGDELVKLDGDERDVICRDHEIPIALGGAARHNVANALAAAALTWCLGTSVATIRNGLITMSQDENPGRCNIYDVGGRKVLVDFAHNPHAMQALFDMAQALPAKRRVLCFGQAGDRTDELIRQLARDGWAIGLDRVVISELANYRRGREEGEVFKLMRDELLSLGARPEQIEYHDTEPQSFGAALDWAEPGDLVIMLALGEAAAIREQLKALQAT